MGCDKGHHHEWNTSGYLVIERCETFCNWCEGEAALKPWKYAWYLRRHVRTAHVKTGQYKHVTVSEDWAPDDGTGAPATRRRRSTKDKKKQVRKSQSPTSAKPLVYSQQSSSNYLPGTIYPAQLQAAAPSFAANETPLNGNYGFYQQAPELSFDDSLPSDNADYWLEQLNAEPPALQTQSSPIEPPVDFQGANQYEPFVDAAYDTANFNSFEELIADGYDEHYLDGFDPVYAAGTTQDVPLLVSDDEAHTSSVNGDGPQTPRPDEPLAATDLFSDDLGFDLDDPTNLFLQDLETPYFDPDDEHLADIYKETPTNDEHVQGMMTFLEMAAQQMQSQGMTVQQMMSCVTTFYQTLAQRVPPPKAPSRGQTRQMPIILDDDNDDPRDIPIPSIEKVSDDSLERDLAAPITPSAFETFAAAGQI